MPRDLSFLDNSVHLVAALMERGGGKVTATADGEVLVEVRGLKIIANTYEDFFILNEVFVLGMYDFFLPEESVVWDIGMNIGVVSLLYASRPDVRRVYSFEPFGETAQLARNNFALNSAFAQKIHLTEAGIGSSDREDVGYFSPDYKGTSGLNPLPEHLPTTSARTETIQLLDAAKVLRSIRESNIGVPIVLKCDCEGAEEEILARLAETDSLRDIDLILLEFHSQSPERLRQLLLESGYSGITLVSPIPGAGMIYAKRNS